MGSGSPACSAGAIPSGTLDSLATGAYTRRDRRAEGDGRVAEEGIMRVEDLLSQRVARFIDRDAEFLYVPPRDVLRTAKEKEAVPYDVPDVAFHEVVPGS